MRTNRPVPVHYLRPNHGTWSPPCIITFDSETRWDDEGDNEVHTLRLWSAELTERRPRKGKTPAHQIAAGTTGADLAATITAWCKGKRAVWCYAHNLGFDLSVTCLIDELCACGWVISEIVVDDSAPWARLNKADITLTLADSWSAMPVKLEAIGDAVRLPKPPNPDRGDDDGWQARCDADVRILTAALTQLMDWWDKNDLGRWSVSGPAAGWNAMRHRPNVEKVLIRPDPAEAKSDRAAIYGGVRFVWQAGAQAAGHYVMWDLEKAYTVAARDLPLPGERLAPFDTLDLDSPWLNCQRHGVIALARVRTERPRYPVRHDRLVWYPTGEFWTTLAGPDLREARDNGDLIEIGPGWLHRLGRYMRPWALWILGILAGEQGDTPDVAMIACRAWARSTIGKWAQRSWSTMELGASPVRGWGHEEAWDHARGCRASVIDFGGRRYLQMASEEGQNSYPAVLAFVESYVRCALFALADAAGDDAVLTCDTDGVLVNATIAGDCPSGPVWGEHFRARPKGSWRHVDVLGPQHLMLDDAHQLAGVPGGAQRDADGRWHARLWPSLPWQLANGQRGSYVRPARTYVLSDTYVPGWVLEDGLVIPARMTGHADRTNTLTPWPSMPHAPACGPLRERQHKTLERYRNIG